jgi:Predicted methyltransferase
MSKPSIISDSKTITTDENLDATNSRSNRSNLSNPPPHHHDDNNKDHSSHQDDGGDHSNLFCKRRSSTILDDDDGDDEDSAPLPLTSLRDRVLPKTFLWLQKHEEEENEWLKLNELESETSGTILQLFSRHCNAGPSSSDEDSSSSDDCRVQEWCSSKIFPDGIGGYCIGQTGEQQEEEEEEGSLRVKYILSESAGGHGDDLWAASRHISNLFADQEKCRDLVSPLFDVTSTSNSAEQQQMELAFNHHPLLGLDFIELGAGAGLPSWTAMRCGAKVVCTDQAIPNRIRCMAESAERNIRYMKTLLVGRDKDDRETAIYKFAVNARVCPYSWGDPIDDILELLSPTTTIQDGQSHNSLLKRFDIVVAADCIYMPQFHESLLESIGMLLSDTGIGLLPFALHGNVNDEEVWNIVNLAVEKGLKVEILESCQLCPQALNMDSKRGLIHVLRLRKDKNIIN